MTRNESRRSCASTSAGRSGIQPSFVAAWAILTLVILGFVLGTTINVAPSLVALLGTGLLVVASRTATAD
jgi:Na+/H+ antiporter NhaD/arsenite permease-like protein